MSASERIEAITSQLADIVGATHLSSAPADVDALGHLEPFAVVWPGSPSEVAAVLRACTELGISVGVTGHGTRVVRHWPVKDDRPRVALDTRRLTNILDVDEVSLTVHTQTGIKMEHLEEALRRQGLTVGPYPPEIFGSTLGGLLAAPPASACSPLAGPLLDACFGVSVAHADGSTLHTRVAPRRATGPDVARLYLGSRGGLGVITSAVLRVHRLPEQVLPLAFALPGLAAAGGAARLLLEREVRPAALRVLGARLSREELGEGLAPAAACLLVLWGPSPLVAREHTLVDALLGEAGGSELPQPLASRWWERRGVLRAACEETARVGARVAWSRLAEALESVAGVLRSRAQHVWLDQVTPQGVTLWLCAPSGEAGREALASGLLDAGLDPLRPLFPPLLDELRGRLDPQGTLVVMEG